MHPSGCIAQMHWHSQKLQTKFYNKHLALRHDKDVSFQMGDQYDRYDWTKEPTGTWKDTLKEHAQRLRDTHKYLRLYYSGGSDSQTILNTFIRNKIHLDEIAVVRMSPTDDFNHESEREQNEVAIPQLIELEKEIFYSTKIKFYNLGYKEYKDWIYRHFALETTNIRSFHIFFPANIHKLIPGINDHDGIGNINGIETPRVGKDHKGTYWYFVDSSLMENIISPEDNIEAKQINFFLDPVLLAKQVHMIKNNDRYNEFTPANFDHKKYLAQNILGVCRDPLYKEISWGKQGGKYWGNPKSQMAVQAAPKQLVEKYQDVLQDHGIDLDCYIDRDPFKGYVGKLSRQYYF